MQVEAGAITWTGWEQLAPFVREFIERRCRDRGAVDDLVQETLMRVASCRERFGEAHSARGWAVRIAQNLMRDRQRARGRELVSDTADGDLDGLVARVRESNETVEATTFVLGSFELDGATALAQVERALAAMNSDDRELLVAFYAGRRGLARVVALSAVPAARVKLRLFRARNRLRRELLRQLRRDRDARMSGAVADDTRQLVAAGEAQRRPW